jgi:ABC-type branched-subunit amino acid transport system permease subunit
VAQMISGTPTVVMVLNSALVGAIAAMATLRLGGSSVTILVVGATGFVVAVALHSWYVQRGVGRLQSGHRPLFPTPEGE